MSFCLKLLVWCSFFFISRLSFSGEIFCSPEGILKSPAPEITVSYFAELSPRIPGPGQNVLKEYPDRLFVMEGFLKPLVVQFLALPLGKKEEVALFLDLDPKDASTPTLLDLMGYKILLESLLPEQLADPRVFPTALASNNPASKTWNWLTSRLKEKAIYLEKGTVPTLFAWRLEPYMSLYRMDPENQNASLENRLEVFLGTEKYSAYRACYRYLAAELGTYVDEVSIPWTHGSKRGRLIMSENSILFDGNKTDQTEMAFYPTLKNALGQVLKQGKYSRKKLLTFCETFPKLKVAELLQNQARVPAGKSSN